MDSYLYALYDSLVLLSNDKAAAPPIKPMEMSGDVLAVDIFVRYNLGYYPGQYLAVSFTLEPYMLFTL